MAKSSKPSSKSTATARNTTEKPADAEAKAAVPEVDAGERDIAKTTGSAAKIEAVNKAIKADSSKGTGTPAAEKPAKTSDRSVATAADPNKTPPKDTAKAADEKIGQDAGAEPSDDETSGPLASDPATSGTASRPAADDAKATGADEKSSNEAKVTQKGTAPDRVDLDAADAALAPEAASELPVGVAVSEPARGAGGFFPALLGGVIAAGVGFGAAYVWLDAPAPDTAALDALRKDVSALQSAPAPQSDTTALETGLTEVREIAAAAGTQISALSDRVTELEVRLTQLSAAGVSSSLSPEAVKAYEAELEALQASMSEQRSALEAAAQAAADAEASAEEAAQATLARAALARVQAALDSGSGFAPALGDLEAAGVDVPGVLSSLARDGVPTMATLRDEFPAAARAALAQARKDAGPDAGAGLTSFLKAQLGARSLEPREGDDPDAILSRAESALEAGHLNDTLAEIAALPETARARMSGWLSAAQMRLDAVAAANALAQDLNQN